MDLSSRLTAAFRGLLEGWKNPESGEDREARLRESEELHRTVAELGYEFSYVARVTDGNVEFYSPQRDVIGELLDPAAGYSNDWNAFIDERDHAAMDASIRDLVETGECRAEFRTRRGPDGSRWLEKFERVSKDEATGVLSVYGAVRDITETKAATERLKQSEEQLRAILESEPECVKTVDRECRLLHMNPAGLRMIEADSMDAVQNADVLEIVEPEYREVFADLNRRVFAGEAVTAEFQIRGLKGTRRWMETHAVPMHDPSGAVVAQLAITRDVSERRRLQEDLLSAQRREALGVMAGGIAHDFNNMLYVILGRAELALRRPSVADDVKRDLTELESAARRAAAITQQILTFSRGPAGEQRSLDLSEVVADAIQLLRATVPATLAIEIDAKEGGPHRVLGDPTQLMQVVVNLGGNAAHALRDDETGKITIEVDTVVRTPAAPSVGGATLAPGRYARLRVSDDGTGMSPEIRRRALEPYFTTKSAGEGSGLGLAVVDGIVRRAGGAVGIESIVGEGTTFEVLLPAYAGEATTVTDPSTELPRGHEKILLIDDEPLVGRTAQGLLEALGYAVEATTSSGEALANVRADPERYDLVVTDQTMPDMTGDTLAREILRIRPGMPIILCSGHAERNLTEQSIDDGIRAYLTKPVELVQLAESVRRVLDS